MVCNDCPYTECFITYCPLIEHDLEVAHEALHKINKPRLETVGDNVSLPNVTISRETAAIPSQNGSVGSREKNNLNANFPVKGQHSDALLLEASSLPKGTHKPKED